MDFYSSNLVNEIAVKKRNANLSRTEDQYSLDDLDQVSQLTPN